MRAPPPLRPYQLEPIKAIIASIRQSLGLTFCVEIARQGGKNEISARLESAVLAAHRLAGGTIVKTAPTMEPQLTTSYNRLAITLSSDRIRHRSVWPAIKVGNASIEFRSAEKSANVVGATASLLLEADEAQDIDTEIFNTRFRPMASTTNATTVLYGTAWSATDLLQQQIGANAEAETADGIRRNFLYDWREVSKYNPLYLHFVESERARLGASHPHFTTQYELQPLAGAGRLLNDQQLAQLQGTHGRERSALAAVTYIAGLDIAGEDTGSDRPNDRTVLTIGAVGRRGIGGIAPIRVVDQIVAQGMQHEHLIPLLIDALRARQVTACTVDATGIGTTTAALLKAEVRACKIDRFVFTQASKSELGFNLITYANTGALKLYANDGSAEHDLTTSELRNASRTLRANATMQWSVPESLGNDDFLVSLALLAQCAKDNPVRQARMR